MAVQLENPWTGGKVTVADETQAEQFVGRGFRRTDGKVGDFKAAVETKIVDPSLAPNTQTTEKFRKFAAQANENAAGNPGGAVGGEDAQEPVEAVDEDAQEQQADAKEADAKPAPKRRSAAK